MSSGGWLRRLCVLIGFVSGVAWLVALVQTVRDDAPDMSPAWVWLLIVTQGVLAGAFLANWRRWRAGPPVLLLAIVGYVIAIAASAAANGGTLLLAVALFAGPPMLAAAPLILPDLFRSGSSDTGDRSLTSGGRS